MKLLLNRRNQNRVGQASSLPGRRDACPNVIVVLFACGCLSFVFLSVSGCGGTTAAGEQPKVVYICEETKSLITAPQQPTPAVHPETNKPTLLRGLYCKQCKKWHAVPPSDVYPRDPLSYHCPRHKSPMSAAGPMEAPILMAKSRRR